MKACKRILALFLAVSMVMPGVSVAAETAVTAPVVTVKAGYSSNCISWGDVDAESYQVFRSVDEGVTYAAIEDAVIADNDSETGYIYTDENIPEGTRYFYKVEASGAEGTLSGTSEAVQDTAAAGMEGLIAHSALAEIFEEGDQTFDGTRVIDRSENAEAVHAVNTGSIIVRFKITDAAGNPVILAANEKGVDPVLNGTSNNTTVFITNNTFRFSYPHTRAGIAVSSNEWHTVVLSSLPTGKYMRYTIDGVEAWSNTVSSNMGMFAKHSALTEVTIGGLLDANEEVTNGFKGEISHVIITDETISDADAIKISAAGYLAEEEITLGCNISKLFDSDPDNTWVFTGGRAVEGGFEDVRGARNYVGHFEEYIRNTKSAQNADDPTRQRYMINTAKEGQTLAQIVTNWEDRVGQFVPQAVAYMVGAEDYGAGSDGIEAFKANLKSFIDLALAEKDGTGFAVIQTPYAVNDNDTNAIIEEYIAAIYEVAETYAAEEAYGNILIADHYEATNTETFKTTMLNTDGNLNIFGHYEIGRLLSLETIKTDASYPSAYGVKTNSAASLYTEEEQPDNYVKLQPAVTSSETAVRVEIPENDLGITGWKYELDMEGIVISGTADSDIFTIDGLTAGKSYVLKVRSQDEETQLSTMKGVIGAGAGTLNQQELNKNQQELADLMESDDSLTWLFMGDSITHGLIYTYGYANMPQIVEKYLKDVLGRDGDVVINTAVSSATTGTTLANIEQRLTKYNPDVVAIMLGTNDAAYESWGGVSTEQYEINLRALIAKIKEVNEDAIIILRSPTPMTGNGDDAAYRRPGTIENIAVMKAVAEELDLIYIDQYAALEEAFDTYSWLSDSGINGRGILGNWLHPGPTGMLLMGKMFIKGCGLWTEDSPITNLFYEIAFTEESNAAEVEIGYSGDKIAVSAEMLEEACGQQLGHVILTATADGQSYQVTANDHEDYAVIENLPGNQTYTVSVEAYAKANAKKITFAASTVTLSDDAEAVIDVVVKDTEAEDLAVDAVVSDISTGILAPTGEYTYTLCDGEGDTHNEYFRIVNDQLVIKKELRQGTTYQIRIKAVNGNYSAEKSVEIYAAGIRTEIPISAMTPTAGSSQSGEGPEIAIDENLSTLWHAAYTNTDMSVLWYQIELEDGYKVDGFRYQPRTSGTNGIITSYKILISSDGNEWTEAASGDWAADSTLKEVYFHAADAKYVKLQALATLSNTGYAFASAAEIRLTGMKISDDHQMEHHPAVAATCATDGTAEYWSCVECGKMFADELGETEITEVQKIPATEAHFWVNGICDKCKTAAPAVDYNVIVFADGEQKTALCKSGVEAGSILTVTAPAVDGKIFSHWSYDMMGTEKISSSKTYTFYVTRHMYLYANYADTEAEQTPEIVISNVYNLHTTKYYIVVEATRDITSDYKVVEQGVLYGTNTALAANPNELLAFEDEEATTLKINTKKYKGSSTSRKGVLSLRISLGTTDTRNDFKIYARGYVIVEKDGVRSAVYSDTVKNSYNDLNGN